MTDDGSGEGRQARDKGWGLCRDGRKQVGFETSPPSRNETHGMRQDEGGRWKTEPPRGMIAADMGMLLQAATRFRLKVTFNWGRKD